MPADNAVDLPFVDQGDHAVELRPPRLLGRFGLRKNKGNRLAFMLCQFVAAL